MKKLCAMIVAVIMIASLPWSAALAAGEAIPGKGETVAAADGKSLEGKGGLENAIRLVKSKIDIPQNYEEFSSEVSSYGNKTQYRLRWFSDSTHPDKNGGSIDVMADDYGIITAYSHYKYERGSDYQRGLPEITKAQALDFAKKYLYYICPDIIDQIAFEDGKWNCSIESEGSYRFYFYRQYKGIPFYDNGLSVVVKGDTGEVTSFNRQWTDGLEFPAPDGAISLESAKKAYRDKAGLTLKYRKIYGQENNRTYLEYLPGTSGTDFGIDAFTGERVDGGSSNNLYYGGDYKATATSMAAGADQVRGEINLSQKELDEVKQMQGLVSVESAEKLARSMAELGIDNTYSLRSYNYGKYSSEDGVYVLRLYFSRPLTDDDMGSDIPPEKIKVLIAAGEGYTVNVAFNAKTSELMNFEAYGGFGNSSKKPAYGRAAMQKVVEQFLSKYKTEKFAGTKLEDSAATDSYMRRPAGDSSESGIFAYIRQVNGIPFEDNRIMVNCDAATGKITSYYESWDTTLEFTPVSRAIGSDRAYNALFRQNGLKLRYMSTQPQAADEKAMLEKVADPQKAGLPASKIKLVYAPDPRKPVCIDAVKGILINSASGEPYRGEGAPRYNDIEKHAAREQITVLAEIGLFPYKESFRPDDAVLQKDLLYMLSKMRGNYITSDSAGALSQEALDGMYRTLINDSVIDEEEKNPDGKVTRENAVKYLLNSLGYRKFAGLEGIFKCEYDDKADINPKLVGYVAIAKALGIIEKDGSFMPKKEITRAEAAVLIYNYLKNNGK